MKSVNRALHLVGGEDRVSLQKASSEVVRPWGVNTSCQRKIWSKNGGQ